MKARRLLAPDVAMGNAALETEDEEDEEDDNFFTYSAITSREQSLRLQAATYQ